MSQSNENIAPSVVMAVAKELRKLTNEPLEGIKVLLNEEDITNIVADIAGPGARRARGLPALDAPLHMAAPLRALPSALWVSPSCGTPPLLGANRHGIRHAIQCSNFTGMRPVFGDILINFEVVWYSGMRKWYAEC